jgi:hypothetical protein
LGSARHRGDDCDRQYIFHLEPRVHHWFGNDTPERQHSNGRRPNVVCISLKTRQSVKAGKLCFTEKRVLSDAFFHT